ncbi:MAG: peptidase T [Acidobacteria bacterium]|nr:peptidase T [Acidobacteriota bacterium]
MSQAFEFETATVLDRFLRYVQVHTTSRDDAESYPSTKCQKDLGKMLVKELKALGLEDAAMDRHGYVTATLPSNLPEEAAANVPVIGLIAHLDTYPMVSGEDVNPVLHENYDGSDLVLPGDPAQVIRVDENKELQDFVGDTIVTSDGTTLLGADDKAGIAEIMAAVEYMVKNPDFKHGAIRIGFTPDEEVGAGTRYFDVEKFGARYAYTLDGDYPGVVENETFCADGAVVKITGKDVHPGYARGKMVNAVRAAAYFIQLFREAALPETTEKREGYLHPHVIEGNVSEVKVHILLRDFEVEGLADHREWLERACDSVRGRFPGAVVELEVKESYRNMVYKLQEHPQVLEYAVEAIERAGLKPIRKAIRGGTDGARLSFMGLPTPNLFAGGMNFHSKQEWVAVSALRKAVETILHLMAIWREKSLGA